jgi:minichromosome maintenance protein 10
MLDDATGGASEEEEADEEDEEDEETLQLRLQQIETRLKLKKLQQKTQKDTLSRQKRSDSPRKLLPPRSAPPETERVEVPLSPVRKVEPLIEQVSPARRRLGLDAPFREQEISLKRARPVPASLRRSTAEVNVPRPKSFSERLLESKEKELQQEARKEHLEELRSSAFGVSRSRTPTAEEQSAQKTSRTQENGRGTITSRIGSVRQARATKEVPHSSSNSSTAKAPSEIETSDAAYDPFSKIHLSKRLIAHSDVAREMSDKEIYTLPRLLKEVKSPDYEAPDCESDYVVFAVLSSKSDPFDVAQTHKQTDSRSNDGTEAPRNKFMVLHLTDLKWEMDLFLFGTAFNQFWKLTPGTLLAILNPAIMPPRGNQHTGRFSLKLGSSDDAVMEIGKARDLGYCSSIKKNGQQCGDWIDKRKTTVCEFHINLQVAKSRKDRMEVNSMFRGTADSPDGRKRVLSKKAPAPGAKKFHHGDYGTLYSVSADMGRSAATLLDADDTDALHSMTREEASRKRIAAAQKERDLARQLVEMGRGAGAEYLRASHPSIADALDRNDAAAQARSALFDKPTIASLGLGAKNAHEARLSPAKDRKRHFGLGEMTTATARKRDLPMGWGGAKQAGLALVSRKSHDQNPSASTFPRERGQTLISQPQQQQEADTANTSFSSASHSAESSSHAARAGQVRPRSQGSSIRSGGSTSPVKKRARFALSKGIREPGRESLPGDARTAVEDVFLFHDDDDDDDDDDLEIV